MQQKENPAHSDFATFLSFSNSTLSFVYDGPLSMRGTFILAVVTDFIAILLAILNG